jgi:uncharacterized protein (DUF697 family)
MPFGRVNAVANLWRVIREVDLQTIRQQALAPFELLIVSDVADQAAKLRALLSPHGELAPHPWIRVAGPAEASGPTVPDAAIVITERWPASAAADAVTRQLRSGRILTIVVHLAAGIDGAAFPVEGHLVVRTLDRDAAQEIARVLLAALPEERRLAFARQLPLARTAYCEALIEETSRANATYSLTTGLAEVVPVLTVPLNLGDMIILTKNQLLMSYRIVLAAGRDGEPRQLIAEIAGVLGSGLLFRQLARQLVGLIPVFGLLPKIAIAYGGTWAIGRATVLWATEGRAITTQMLRTLGAEGLERGRRIARELADRARLSPRPRASRDAPPASRDRGRENPPDRDAGPPPGAAR